MSVTEPFTEKLPESIESTKFAPHRAGVSGEFDSRKDSHPTKFAQRTWILVKLSFREFCDSKTSGLYAFNYTAISLNQKKGKFWKGRLWLNEDIEDSSIMSNDSQVPWEYQHHQKIAGESHFHVWDVTKNTLVFLFADGEAFWSLLPKLVSLLSGSTVQPENTYSYILKVTGQVWESQKG